MRSDTVHLADRRSRVVSGTSEEWAMLDALKGLSGGTRSQKQKDDLEELIARAREERSALSTMLT
ncbi:MAG: hypothetical protein FJW23_03145 [Acidimicrobiia bacterium]|nr:hypothetical protein [Acidimicrobiia bacterium]